MASGQTGECLDWQCKIGAWAGLDESGSESEDGIQAQGCAVRIRCGNLTDGFALQAGVQCLRHEDGSSNAKIVFARDESRAAKIGRGSYSLEHRGERDEALNVGVREVVFASSNGLGTSSCQCCGQELHVFFFVMNDVFEVVVVAFAESSGPEGGKGIFANSPFIENIL